MKPEKGGKIMAEKYVFVVDLRKCVGCYSCQVACKQENDVPIGKFRATVKIWQDGRYPDVKWRFLPQLCNHCDASPCIPSCPVPGATYKQDDGLVLIDKEQCIGCGKCVVACPYDARYVWDDNKADKCTFCTHLLKQELAPACVRSCMGKARFIGNINDSESIVSQLIARNKDRIAVLKPELNAKPMVYYILDDRKQLEEV